MVAIGVDVLLVAEVGVERREASTASMALALNMSVLGGASAASPTERFLVRAQELQQVYHTARGRPGYSSAKMGGRSETDKAQSDEGGRHGLAIHMRSLSQPIGSFQTRPALRSDNGADLLHCPASPNYRSCVLSHAECGCPAAS